jgi:hypothetical protein
MPELNIRWQTGDIDEEGMSGTFSFDSVEATVVIDPNQDEHQLTHTMLHELIEMIARLNHVNIEHEDLDDLACALADFVLQYGFDPQRVISKT